VTQPAPAATTPEPTPEGCRTCGTTEPPLHPDGVTSTPVGDSILRRDSVVCTQHLVLPQ
jgi:hypothetical protein